MQEEADRPLVESDDAKLTERPRRTARSRGRRSGQPENVAAREAAESASGGPPGDAPVSTEATGATASGYEVIAPGSGGPEAFPSRAWTSRSAT